MSILDQIVDGPSRQRPILGHIRTASKPVIIYGAGVYAYVLQRFLALNCITVEAVMVDAACKTDDFFMGLQVIATEEAVNRLADCIVVVGITTYPEQMDKLKRLGAGEVYVIDIPDYLNMPEPFMDMRFVKEHLEQFDQAARFFADELSRQTYIAAINAKLNEDLEYLKPVVRLDNLYFPASEFNLRADEVLLDVGGFTGDTVRDFHNLSGGNYAQIISLEPCEENYRQLRATVQSLGLTKVLPLKIGAWDQRTTLRFATREMDIDNQITADGEHQIEVDTIDSILGNTKHSVTLIKLDINGAEYRALAGAQKTIRRHRPRIVVRLHTKEDFFRLPLLLHRSVPDMKLYLRQRNYMSMMVVLYGVFDLPLQHR